MTVEPHSLEWAVALASGSARRPSRGILPGQFDDPLVVDVVQHEIRCPGPAVRAPWRLGSHRPYMDWQRRKNSPAVCRRRPDIETSSAAQRIYEWDSGARRQVRRRLPGDTPVCSGPVERRTDMDASIKSFRPGKPLT